MKKFLTVLMAAFMIVSSFSVCMAEEANETQPADVLYNLGLFNGTGTEDGKPVFGLENKLSRQEATALLVRLLGKEAEAQKEISDTPFTDVDDWAKPYVGYAYNHGIVNGIGETSFGSANPISATEYLTLILRALGHDDKQGDFLWDSAWVLSDSLGMTKEQYNNDTNAEFYRKDAALISYMSLFQKIKGEERTLANKLYTEEVFSAEQLESTNEPELIEAAGIIETPEVQENSTQVAQVTGITFEQRGVYVKMTLLQPEDKTGIVSYEALIYDKNNPETMVHRSITLEDGTAHYRLDDPEIFAVGQEFNAIKVTSNGAEGYAPAFWEADISVMPVQNDITITEAWVVNDDEIDLNLADVEKGYMGYIFTRKDETIVDEDTFFDYKESPAKYRANLKDWSVEDKQALENGEISVAITGMNIIEMAETDGKWKVEFERIKAPKIVVKCDVDIVE